MSGLIILMCLVVLAVILAGASASALPDPGTPLADIGVTDDNTTACQIEGSDYSPNAAIAITMYAVEDG